MVAESFVGRWSRLKRRAESSTEPQEQDKTREDPAASPVVPCAAAIATATGSGASMEPSSQSTASPAVQQSGKRSPTAQDVGGEDPSCKTRLLPDIASLGADSDLSMFMGADVDPQLRVRALKKLFTDPHFNRMDGLDVYVDDYSKPDPMPLAFIRRLDQSRILGLSDEPAPDHAVPGEAEARTPDGSAAAADQAAASNRRAGGGEAAASGAAGDATEPEEAANGMDAAGAVEAANGMEAAGEVEAAVAARAATAVKAARAAEAAARLDRTG
jgi:hypothetical protein